MSNLHALPDPDAALSLAGTPFSPTPPPSATAAALSLAGTPLLTR